MYVAPVRDLMNEDQRPHPPSPSPRQEQAHARRVGVDFVSDPLMVGKLIVFASVVIAQQNLMRRFLDMSSDDWDKQEDGKHAFALAEGLNNRRRLRVLVAYSGEIELAFLSELAGLLSSDRISSSLLASEHITTLKVLAFRLVSASGGLCHQTLVFPHRRFPFRLFAMATGAELAEGGLASALKGERKCLMDSWSLKLIEHWGEGLDTEDAKADIVATALQLQMETAQIEAKHAAIRRRVLKASMHCYAQTVPHASADFCLGHIAQQRRLLAEIGGEAGVQPPTSKKPLVKSKCLKRKRGGGGPWRAFVHAEASGSKRRADLKTIGEKYRRLDPQQLAELEQVGALATRAHRHGMQSFGPQTRQLDRARRAQRRARDKELAGEQAAMELRQACGGAAGHDGQLVATASTGTLACVPSHIGAWSDFMSATKTAARRLDLSRLAQKEKVTEALRSWTSAASQEDGGPLATGMLPTTTSCLTPLPLVGPLGRRWRLSSPGSVQVAAQAVATRGELAIGKAVKSALQRVTDNEHTMIAHDEVEAPADFGARKPVALCFEAGFCLCGRERCVRMLGLRLMSVFKEVFPATSNNRAFLLESRIGCLLTGECTEQQAECAAELSSVAAAERQVFLHVAHQSLSPFRPTFQKMEVQELFGGKAKCKATPVWQTFWEAARGLPADWTWKVRFFNLVDNYSLAGEFDVQMQEYTELPAPSVVREFWQGRDIAAMEAEEEDPGQGWLSEEHSCSEGNSGSPESSDVGDAPDTSDDSPSAEESSSSDSSSSSSDSYETTPSSEEGGAPPAEEPPADVGDAMVAVAPGPPVPAGGGPIVAGGRRPAEGVVLVPGGELRYYQRINRFQARCTNPAHGSQCRKERVAQGGRKAAQGRPLGFLAAWLAQGALHADQEEHQNIAASIAFDVRAAAREALRNTDGSAELFSAERPLRAGETDEPRQDP